MLGLLGTNIPVGSLFNIPIKVNGVLLELRAWIRWPVAPHVMTHTQYFVKLPDQEYSTVRNPLLCNVHYFATRIVSRGCTRLCGRIVLLAEWKSTASYSMNTHTHSFAHQSRWKTSTYSIVELLRLACSAPIAVKRLTYFWLGMC